MPPLYQDPLSAVRSAEWRWLDVARALAEVSCEPWVLALVALAVYSFLERDVKGLLKAMLPLGVALVAAGSLALLARAIGGMPRPVAAADHALAPLLRRAFPSAQTTAVAVFATWTALAYGRRARWVLAATAVVGGFRALGGPHWGADLAGGCIAGLLFAAITYVATLRLFPQGHLARLRACRGPTASAEPRST